MGRPIGRREQADGSRSSPPYEVIVIGAGVCGIYQLHRLVATGRRVLLLEAGGDVGGTWYWNRYPGARFDSESYSYGYSFSKELLEEWDWSEHFASQPETLTYLNHVVDKFDLRPSMQFDSTVTAARYDDATRTWTVELADGRTYTTRFLMTAMGMFSVPTLPRLEGMDDFEGLSFHTSLWPHEPVDLTAKKVAVVGTGATGVQVISEIASQVGHLTVFQRRPNWCVPLGNEPIDAETMKSIKDSYDDIFQRCHDSPFGFLHSPDELRTFDVSEAERRARWEELYRSRGFSLWLGNYRDVLVDVRANAELSAFVANKIRQRVHDPDLAEKLIPQDHGFGTRRVPMETNYYEAYNRPNVELVDLRQTPIERVTPRGIRTSEADHEFDIIIYATGFDAVTGPFDRIDFVGLEGQHLRDKWRDGPLTLYGIQTAGFPNLITLCGPQSASVATNFPRGIEEIVNWSTELLEHMWEHGSTRIAATPEAEVDWVAHVKDMADKILVTKVKSWMTGYNTNIDRDDEPRYVVYTGGALRYRALLQDVAADGYRGFEIS